MPTDLSWRLKKLLAIKHLVVWRDCILESHFLATSLFHTLTEHQKKIIDDWKSSTRGTTTSTSERTKKINATNFIHIVIILVSARNCWSLRSYCKISLCTLRKKFLSMLHQHHILYLLTLSWSSRQKRKYRFFLTAFCSTLLLDLCQDVTPDLCLLFGYTFEACPEQFKSPISLHNLSTQKR